MADRSTGVQQALVAYKHRYCGGRVHLENRGEGEWYLAAVCDRCGDTDGLDLEAVRVVEAVSPEPRPTDEELLGRLRRLVADDEQRLGPVPESVMREVAESWPPEPREGEQEEEMREGEPAGEGSLGRGGGVAAAAAADGQREVPPSPAGSPSVASELRLTASRLRDPEYHWYEHAAVTLERLAERLEKGDG